MSVDGRTAAPSRRERVRAATVEEIKRTARALLVKDGPAGISLRAIAREMGMTAAGLYRYFPNLEGLVDGLCADLYDEVRQFLERARDEPAMVTSGDRLFAMCRAFRRWSIDHPAEFGVMFGSPLPGIGPDPADRQEHAGSIKHQAGMRFAGAFAALFAEIWSQAPFPVAAPEDIPADLRRQLQAYADDIDSAIPLGALQLFLSCWIRLYGMVALEVYGHLHFALTEIEPMFEAELTQVAKMLGVAPRSAPP